MESDDVAGYWLSVCGPDKMTARNTALKVLSNLMSARSERILVHSVPIAEKPSSASTAAACRPYSSRTSIEMWQKPTEHAAGSVCYRNALNVKSVIKVY